MKYKGCLLLCIVFLTGFISDAFAQDCDVPLNLTVVQPNCINPTGSVIVNAPLGSDIIYMNGVSESTVPAFNLPSGMYNFSYKRTSGCVSQTTSVVLNEVQVPTIAPVSGTAPQSVCIGFPITPIVYAVGNGATGATVMQLPLGVSGVYLSSTGMFTIAGTPQQPGNYVFTVQTVGGCSTDFQTGMIIVKPNTSMAWSPSGGLPNQSVCQNSPIEPIKYNISAATGATVIGLPAGLSGSYVNGAFTIQGTPAVSGEFNYAVTTVGGCLPNATLTGSIQVGSIAPFNLVCSNITVNSVRFSWDMLSWDDDYEVTYSIDNAPGIFNAMTNVNSFLVDGLSAGQIVSFTVSMPLGANDCRQPDTQTCQSILLDNATFEKPALQCHPNPVNDLLMITNYKKIQNITIYNVLGSRVYARDLDAAELQIDLSGLNAGIYFVNVVSDGSKKAMKIVKR